jgi:hypothetical protein
MEKVKVFKVYRELAWILITMGSVTFLYGFALLVKALIQGFNSHFPSGDWVNVFFVIQGPLFIVMGSVNLRNTRYYIEWNDNEIHLFLPGTKEVVKILFRDIRSVNIKLFEIEIELDGKRRIINLETLQIEDLRKIKEKFKSLPLDTVK